MVPCVCISGCLRFLMRPQLVRSLQSDSLTLLLYSSPSTYHPLGPSFNWASQTVIVLNSGFSSSTRTTWLLEIQPVHYSLPAQEGSGTPSSDWWWGMRMGSLLRIIWARALCLWCFSPLQLFILMLRWSHPHLVAAPRHPPVSLILTPLVFCCLLASGPGVSIPLRNLGFLFEGEVSGI